MGQGKNWMPKFRDDDRSLFVVFFIVLFFVLREIAIFASLALFLVFFIFIIIQIFGNDIEMDRMDLRDLQLRLALGTTEDLAFFDFVLVDVDFSRTFWAANQGSILRTYINGRRREDHEHPLSSVLYIGVKSTPPGWMRLHYAHPERTDKQTF
jgi:hypothetical protein